MLSSHFNPEIELDNEGTLNQNFILNPQVPIGHELESLLCDMCVGLLVENRIFQSLTHTVRQATLLPLRLSMDKKPFPPG